MNGEALPAGVDHLVYAVADLEAGMDDVERLLGVRPVIGGRHRVYGTHNALLSLGDSIYLEIIAADPDQSRPERGLVFHLDEVEASRLDTWVLQTTPIEDLAREAAAAGLDLGPLLSGGREKPDGSRVTWKVTDPFADRLGGTVPFLIDWGDSAHPAASTPRGGELVDLRIEHPEPERVRMALAALGCILPVHGAGAVRLTATIQTSRGLVDLG